MVYIRGNAYDYDRWAGVGCAGWSYEDVLPYFRRSEDNERGGDRFHGTGGPLRVSDARSVHPLIHAWVAAALEAGHPPNGDFNGAAQDGVGVYQMTQRDGLRASAATAYLRPALARPNLSVLTSTRALRITFRRRRVVGVEVEHLGATRSIGARREVVLSAGAYQSPQLLLLSGIGATEQLEGFGIPVIAESPEVGENLQDHPGCFLSILTTTPDLSDADTPENEALLRRHGHGPLTWTEGGGFLRTRADSAVPDVQFHVAPGMFLDEGLSPAIGPAISFGPYVNRPRSRGRVTLRSALAQAKPRIVHNYLTDGHDRAVLRDGLRLAMEIARQPALGPRLKDVRASVEAGLLPPSDADDLDRYHAPGRVLVLPPRRDVPDGSRRGLGAPGPWRRRSTRGGHVDHARLDRRKHERPRDDDRRKGRRSDSRAPAYALSTNSRLRISTGTVRSSATASAR